MPRKKVIQEEEEQEEKKQYTNLVDIQDDLEILWDKGEKMDKRKKRAYEEWKSQWNSLSSLYNKMAGWKCYIKIK